MDRIRVNLFQASCHGSDYTSLYNIVPQKCLPTEYGGAIGSIDSICQFWQDKIIEHRDYLIEEESFGFDESLAKTIPRKPFFGLFSY